ncbi:MAG: hypothetical protein GXY26_06870 [Clostridiales bacterium]|nr:hypothetical protein [Clostridiales bacterium]
MTYLYGGATIELVVNQGGAGWVSCKTPSLLGLQCRDPEKRIACTY